MFAFKEFKILSMLVFLNLMIASGHATGSSTIGPGEDSSLDGQIGRAPSTLFKLAISGAMGALDLMGRAVRGAMEALDLKEKAARGTMGAIDLTRRAAHGAMNVMARNPMPFVVVGTCLLMQQVEAASFLPDCEALMDIMANTIKGVGHFSFNSTTIPCIEGENFYCCEIPPTEERSPLSLYVSGCKYICETLDPKTLICPTPGSTFCRLGPWANPTVNATCWTTPMCGATH